MITSNKNLRYVSVRLNIRIITMPDNESRNYNPTDFLIFHQHHLAHISILVHLKINEHWRFLEAFQEYDQAPVGNNTIVDFYPSRFYNPYTGFYF